LEVPLEDILGRRMPPKDGEAEGTSNSEQDGGDEGNKNGASQSMVFHTPLAIRRQKILMHRLRVAEKKLEAVAKIVRELDEEIREIGALAEDLFGEEESNAPTPSTGSV
jgi:hypothetical protein